jgi:hypothetical protein
VAGAVTLTITAGSAGQDDPPRAPKAPAAQAAAGPQPPAAPVAAQIRGAEPGWQLGNGPSVTIDEVTLTGAAKSAGATAVRLTITGTFPLRDLDPTVLVDDKPVGRGISATDARSLRVAVSDPAVLKTGAVVAYRYGNGPVTVVGPLAKGVK